MSERKEQRERRPQGKYVPLRVRFRPPGEQTIHTHVGTISTMSTMVQVPDLTYATESQRHAQQIKELIRLGNLLRAELGLQEVLQQIVASISACTGFRALVINLMRENDEYVHAVAFAGSTEEEQHFMIEHPISVAQMHRLMLQRFRISHSYFIPYEDAADLTDIFESVVVPGKIAENYVAGNWHHDDMLIVPLFSPRQNKLLGFLSLDEPVDEKRPTLESIEVVELFANQAAIAIDNARIFQEREAERVALEEGIVQLREDLEQIQRGDLRMRVRPLHKKLQPIGNAMNAMTEAISGILGNVRQVTQAVEEHMRNMQRISDFLVHDTGQQERQVHQISHAIRDIADMMHHVSSSLSEKSRPPSVMVYW